jgi:hypothetical protein
MAREHETIHDAGERTGKLLDGSTEREEVIAFVRNVTIELEALDKKFENQHRLGMAVS